MSVTLSEFWQLHRVPHRPGVSKDVLGSFERRNGVTLPAAMRAAFLASEGTWVAGAPGCDENGFSFWPLECVQRTAYLPWAFVFADFREESWWYAVDLLGEGPGPLGSVYLVGGEGYMPQAVAADFDEFVDLYMRDDQRLYVKSEPPRELSQNG